VEQTVTVENKFLRAVLSAGRNRFKAPRKNLGAFLFSPQEETGSKLRGKTSGLFCSLRKQVQSSEEKPRGFVVLSAGRNRFKAPRKNLGAFLFSPQTDSKLRGTRIAQGVCPLERKLHKRNRPIVYDIRMKRPHGRNRSRREVILRSQLSPRISFFTTNS
jgi:hypothetical protein